MKSVQLHSSKCADVEERLDVWSRHNIITDPFTQPQTFIDTDCISNVPWSLEQCLPFCLKSDVSAESVKVREIGATVHCLLNYVSSTANLLSCYAHLSTEQAPHLHKPSFLHILTKLIMLTCKHPWLSVASRNWRRSVTCTVGVCLVNV